MCMCGTYVVSTEHHFISYSRSCHFGIKFQTILSFLERRLSVQFGSDVLNSVIGYMDKAKRAPHSGPYCLTGKS